MYYHRRGIKKACYCHKNKNTLLLSSLINLYQPITTNYMIMNIIDLERPPIVCIEAAMRNGSQALRLIVWVRKWY